MSIYERMAEEKRDGRKATERRRKAKKARASGVRDWRSYWDAARRRKAYAASAEGQAVIRHWKELRDATKNAMVG